jgi:pyridoxal phosphate enzyme (YggS family)
MSIDVALVAERVASVQARIERAAPGRAVTLVAVTKGFGADAVRASCAAGVADVGENYAQELLAKATQITEPVRWHFIGRLQRNKVRHLAPHVHLWQSVDRVDLVHEIARHAPGAAVCIQVNVSDESAKGGCRPDETAALVAAARHAALEVRGLMAVARAANGAGTDFAMLDALASGLDLPERSMGMTDDFELALVHGATMVRVGRALFGPRPAPTVPSTMLGDTVTERTSPTERTSMNEEGGSERWQAR